MKVTIICISLLFTIATISVLCGIEPITVYKSKDIQVEVYSLSKEYVVRLYLPDDRSSDIINIFLFNDKPEVDDDFLVVLPMKYWTDFKCFYVMVKKYYKTKEFCFHGEYKNSIPYYIGASNFSRDRVVFTLIQDWHKGFLLKREDDYGK